MARIIEIEKDISHQKYIRSYDCFARVDGFGRVFLDTCETDDEHAVAPVPEGYDRRKCRVYLDRLFEDFLDKKGKFIITVTFYPEGEESE